MPLVVLARIKIIWMSKVLGDLHFKGLVLVMITSLRRVLLVSSLVIWQQFSFTFPGTSIFVVSHHLWSFPITRDACTRWHTFAVTFQLHFLMHSTSAMNNTYLQLHCVTFTIHNTRLLLHYAVITFLYIYLVHSYGVIFQHNTAHNLIQHTDTSWHLIITLRRC